MKIQCDVCDKNEASVFCVADEAALCSACDHRVHHANKLAGKHQRFSLHLPSPKQIPLCDICQERRAFLFCQQDRAILCRECDTSIHKANEHTKKHNRFLLTGVKLSSTCALYAQSSSSGLNNSDDVTNMKFQQSKRNSVSHSTPNTANSTTTGAAPGSCDASISEYSTEMLPGWHVEDFLDSSAFASPYSFCKNGENDQVLLQQDWEGDIGCTFPREKMGSWVPQLQQSFVDMPFGARNGKSKEFTTNNIKCSRKWSSGDYCFNVPQICPISTALKRSRTLC